MVLLRFPIAALFFLIVSFIFFVIWLIMTYMLSVFNDNLSPLGSSLSVAHNASFQNILVQVNMAFGVICVLFFVMGIILVFVLESWSDEPEYYYRK